MKVQDAIKKLQELDPNDDIIMDYWVKQDFDHVLDDDDKPMTDREWSRMGHRAENLEWYSELQDLAYDVLSERE